MVLQGIICVALSFILILYNSLDDASVCYITSFLFLFDTLFQSFSLNWNMVIYGLEKVDRSTSTKRVLILV